VSINKKLFLLLISFSLCLSFINIKAILNLDFNKNLFPKSKYENTYNSLITVWDNLNNSGLEFSQSEELIGLSILLQNVLELKKEKDNGNKIFIDDLIYLIKLLDYIELNIYKDNGYIYLDDSYKKSILKLFKLIRFYLDGLIRE